MTRRPITIATAVVAAAGLGAGGGVATYAALRSGGNPATQTVRQVTVRDVQPTASSSALSVNEIYRRSAPGVVEITVTSTQSSGVPFGADRTQQAQASGFVYDRQGDIVTNQHVVDGATSVRVRFSNGATYTARVVGSDASTDLAVIRVDAPSSLLHPLTLADSSGVAVGDGVVAIGSPFGLEDSVTSGIVSAVHRQIDSPNGFAIDDAIQTDAAVNHGNSGGPLLDMQGRVIGVVSQIESESGGNDGVGFAIPANTARSIVGQLLSSGKAEHAFLGVSVETIPSSVASRLGVPAGVEVARVTSGTPADKAGLRAATGSRTVDGQSYPTGGDVITAIDGAKVTTSDELRSAIGAKRPGTTISVTYTRSGKSHTVRVKLTSRPS